jgi:hypothetical protein
VQQAQKEADMARRRAKTIRVPTVNSATTGKKYPQPDIYAGASIPVHPTMDTPIREASTKQEQEHQQTQPHATSHREAAQHQQQPEHKRSTSNYSDFPTDSTEPNVSIEPFPVRGLRVKSRTGRSVTLEWGAPANAHEPGRVSGACEVSMYELQVREGIFPWVTMTTGIKGFACKKNNLEPGREYGFR